MCGQIEKNVSHVTEKSVDLACSAGMGTLPRCRSIHETADGKNTEKQRSNGKERGEPVTGFLNHGEKEANY